MDLIVKNARIEGEEKLTDIAVQDGTIVRIAPDIQDNADKTVDAEGRLTAPTFVDPHIHLDKCLISETVRENKSGTLTEAIEIIWERKKNYTADEIAERACRAVQWAVQNGTTKLRTHVDVDPIGGLTPLEGVAKARKMCADIAEIQIVAFPQEGIIQAEGTEELMRQAMEKGADIIGGMPYNEMTDVDSMKHIDIVFDIAAEYDCDIDMHVDETDDDTARTLQYFAAKAIKTGMKGRVTSGHTCALSAYNPYYAAKIIGLVATADMNMITNPATNLMLEGRRDTVNKRRGLTRVKELMEAGVNVCYGQDCIKDTFYPTFGKADLLEVGMIAAHAAQLSMPADINALFRMPTHNAARCMRLEKYGLKEGAKADFNILDCETVQEAFRLQPDRTVFFRGSLTAQRTTRQELFRQN